MPICHFRNTFSIHSYANATKTLKNRKEVYRCNRNSLRLVSVRDFQQAEEKNEHSTQHKKKISIKHSSTWFTLLLGFPIALPLSWTTCKKERINT